MSKIATTVYDKEEIVVNNEERDIALTLRPLPIGRLREFMNEWNQLKSMQEERGDDLTEDDIFGVYVRCCAVALRKQITQHFDGDIFNERKEFSDEYIEFLEEFLDLPTIVKILDVCGGITLGDPKLQENLEALMALEAQAGKD